MILHVQDALEINFEMKVGSALERIPVEGGAPLVNTESATVSTVIDSPFVENLPLNGRSFQTLIMLTPGVVIVSSIGTLGCSPVCEDASLWGFLAHDRQRARRGYRYRSSGRAVACQKRLRREFRDWSGPAACLNAMVISAAEIPKAR